MLPELAIYFQTIIMRYFIKNQSLPGETDERIFQLHACWKHVHQEHPPEFHRLPLFPDSSWQGRSTSVQDAAAGGHCTSMNVERQSVRNQEEARAMINPKYCWLSLPTPSTDHYIHTAH